ncbi:MAG: phospholipase D family protein [Bdellovibrionota bacterium]
MKHLLFIALFLIPFTSMAINHSDSIPYPFYAQDTSGENQMMPLHKAEESFQLRLELIRKAQRSIEVEYYIYNLDLAGKIFTRELVKAADRGVKVRILVDKLITLLDPFVAHELEKHGIEVKYYNTNQLFKLHIINYRNHRKLLAVDGMEAITGGRNMGDDYFNLDHRYNFDDRDVYVKGPIVNVMRDSFTAYFENKVSKFVKRRTRPVITNSGRGGPDGVAQQRAWDKSVKKAQDFLLETDEELNARAAFERVGNEQLAQNNIYPCPVTTFVTDTPGAKQGNSKEEYRANYRNVRKTFLDKILPIDKALTISSPYFIPNDRNEFIFEDLLKRGIELTLYSNSLRSTDAIFMSASLYLHLKNYLRKGMKVFFHDGKWSQEGEAVTTEAPRGDWGTHSKTHIYETTTYSEVMIGTYNIDNRSDYYNTELAVFCKGNDDFAQNVKADVMALAEKGIKVESLTEARDRSGNKINITGADPVRELKMKIFTLPSWLVGHLL